MGAGHDLGADLSQMLIHRLCVGRWHDDGSPDATSGADGAKQVGGVMTIVSHHERARADWRPDVGMGPLLADTCFVLKPDLYRRAGGAAEQRILQQSAEVFLKARSAAGSFFGWTGRGCSRVRPSWCSHLPTVLSCTGTEKRRSITACRSGHRHRTTPSRAGSGPSMTSAFNSAFCASVSRGARPGLLRDFRPSIPSSL